MHENYVWAFENTSIRWQEYNDVSGPDRHHVHFTQIPSGFPFDL